MAVVVDVAAVVDVVVEVVADTCGPPDTSAVLGTVVVPDDAVFLPAATEVVDVLPLNISAADG